MKSTLLAAFVAALAGACGSGAMSVAPGDGGIGAGGQDGPSLGTGGSGGAADPRDAPAADLATGADTRLPYDLPPAQHACTKAGMVMRCQLTYIIGEPMDTRECTCRCFPPDAPATRDGCDPAEYTCCGWQANTETCHCANQNYITRVSQSCEQYRATGMDMPVNTCP